MIKNNEFVNKLNVSRANFDFAVLCEQNCAVDRAAALKVAKINQGGLLVSSGELSGIVYVKGVNVLCDWKNGDHLEVQPAAFINGEVAVLEFVSDWLSGGAGINGYTGVTVVSELKVQPAALINAELGGLELVSDWLAGGA